MTLNRSLKALLSGALVLAALAGTASAQDGSATKDQAQQRIRERIQERIRTSQDLSDADRTQMQSNLEASLRAGVADPGLEAVFPGQGRARRVSTQTLLQLQAHVRAMAQEGLPVEPVLAKVQEARMKGVPDPGLAQVGERVARHVREARRIVTQARADGIRPAADPARERQMVRELAQQMWRGVGPEDVDALRRQAHERARARECAMEDLVAASETATRLREEGVEARRAMRIAGEALRRGYGAEELRKFQYMMVYRHRENRAVKGLVDDFEHCLDAGMDSAHMYRYMMQNGWMGPGDVQGPGGSRPIDDQGRGRGTPGSRTGGPGGDYLIGQPGAADGGSGGGPGTGESKGGR